MPRIRNPDLSSIPRALLEGFLAEQSLSSLNIRGFEINEKRDLLPYDNREGSHLLGFASGLALEAAAAYGTLQFIANHNHGNLPTLATVFIGLKVLTNLYGLASHLINNYRDKKLNPE